MKLEYGKQIYYNVCCELQLQINCTHILLLYDIIFFAILYCIYFFRKEHPILPESHTWGRPGCRGNMQAPHRSRLSPWGSQSTLTTCCCSPSSSLSSGLLPCSHAGRSNLRIRFIHKDLHNEIHISVALHWTFVTRQAKVLGEEGFGDDI